jgi:hypothetical protein
LRIPETIYKEVIVAYRERREYLISAVDKDQYKPLEVKLLANVKRFCKENDLRFHEVMKDINKT